MISKGIEFRTFNNFIPNHIQRDFIKNQPIVRPIERISKVGIWTDIKHTNRSASIISRFTLSEEDARLASQIMTEHLQDIPELESEWKYDQENHILVIEIKNKVTGQVLRQIPAEEILSSTFAPEKDFHGNIINKIA